MKKLLVISLVFVVGLAVLTGCSQSSNNGSNSNAASNETSGSSSQQEPQADKNPANTQATPEAFDVKAFTPSGATEAVETEGAFTCVSTQTMDDLVSFYESALSKAGASGNGAKADAGGMNTWTWSGKAADGKSLTVGVTDNPLGEGYLIAIVY